MNLGSSWAAARLEKLWRVHTSTGARVAVKVVRKLRLRNNDWSGVVENELQILPLIRHKNVLRLHEVMIRYATVMF